MGIQRSRVAAHQFLRLDDFGIALRIHHERDAHGLDGLVHPGVREDIALVLAVRFAAIGLARLDEVVDAAVAAHGRDIGALAHRDAMRNPVHDQSLGALIPERAVNRVFARVDHVETVRGRRRFHMHADRACRALAPGRLERKHIVTGLRERGRGDRRSRIGKHDCARPRSLDPAGAILGRIFEPGDFAGEIGSAVAHHGAVDAGIHYRRKRRNRTVVEDPPLENSRRPALSEEPPQAAACWSSRVRRW